MAWIRARLPTTQRIHAENPIATEQAASAIHTSLGTWSVADATPIGTSQSTQ